MIIQINRAKKSDRVMRAITGLDAKAFSKLSQTFGQVLNKHIHQQVASQPRQRAIGGGKKHTLTTAEDKLFFILFYLKCYPTFDVAGFFYNVNRSRCHEWAHFLMPLLEKTLGRELVLPKRKISSMEEFIRIFPEVKDVFIDGTERPIQRPKKSKQQQKNYSGKKKRHTKKNILLTDERKRVLVLSATKPGKWHDYALLKKSELPAQIPKPVGCWLDLGFKGIANDYDLSVVMPHKKPRTTDLTEEQKQENRLISGIRVVGEHAISGVKRLNCVTDVYRNRKVNVADQFMLLSCGIWNYHLAVA